MIPFFARLAAIAWIAAIAASSPARADAKGAGAAGHDHDHSHEHAAPARSFGSLAEGLAAVDATLKQAEAAAAEGRAGAFHDLGLELHAVADGLGVLKAKAPSPKQARFEGSVNQLRTVGDRMHDLQPTAPVADAQRLIGQARSIEKIIKANAE